MTQPPTQKQPPSVEDAGAAITLLHRQYPVSYLLIPQTMERIAKFEASNAGAGRSERLPALFERSFCSDDPWMICVVAHQYGEIVAHALASLERILGEPYYYVSQVEKDKGANVDISLVFQTGLAYAQSQGVRRVLAYPAGEAQSRLLQKHGLKPIAPTLSLNLYGG